MKKADIEARAASLGIKPASVRMAQYRENLRQRIGKKEPPPFETFGLKLSAQFQGELKQVRKRLEQASAFVGKARVELERLLRSKLPVPLTQLQQLEALCLALEERIAEAQPRSLCPYCKGIDRVQVECDACLQTGMASVKQYAAAPRRLKEAPVVIVAGRETAIDELAAERLEDPLGE